MLNISDFPWAEFSMRENRVEYVSDSVSLKRQRRSTGIVRYEIELVTIDMDMRTGRSVKAQLSRAKETNDLLSFIHPRLSYSMGIEPAEGIEISTTTGAGANNVPMTSTGSWSLLAGDHIQFSNDTKVYEVAEDTSFTTGIQSVKLTTPLRNQVTAGSAVTVNDVPFFLDVDGIIEYSTEASENQDIQITLQAVERL